MKYVNRSIQSLTPRQRSRLLIFLILQLVNSTLDVIGVFLIGLLVLQSQVIAVSQTATAMSSLSRILPSNYLGFSQSASLLILLVSSLFFFSVKAVVAPYLQKKLLIFLGGVSVNFSRDLTARLFSQDILFNQRRTTQEKSIIVIQGSFQAFQGIIGSFALIVSELVIIIGVLVLLLALNPYLTLFIIVYFGLIVAILNPSLKKVIEKHNKIFNDSSISSSAIMHETLSSYREVFVNQKIDYFVEILVSDLQNSIKSRASLTWASILPKYVLDTSLILGIGMLGGFTYILDSPEAAIISIGIFLVGASRIMPSLLRLNTGIQGVQNCSDASNRLYNLVADLVASEGKNDKIKSIFHSRTISENLIVVRALNFQYPGTKELVLKDLSFNVKKGEFLAIVGPSGSGKSTLVDLLIGVINDPTGSIYVGDATPRAKVRSNPGFIGYVPQSVAMFTRSFKENIAFGVQQHMIDDIKIEGAVTRAALSELVNSLPLGLNTMVGQNGYNFSGGQKQRIGLARAFYSNPEILILDEATSALDAETEHQISQMLSSLAGDLTLIVVAHRLATVQKADKILYLGNAGFSAVGTFEELRVKVPNFDIQAKLLGL